MKKLIGKGLYQLSKNDLIKGFVTAMFTVLVTYVGQAVESGTFPTDKATWILEFKIAFGAGLAYLVKNFLTNSHDKILKKESEPIEKIE